MRPRHQSARIARTPVFTPGPGSFTSDRLVAITTAETAGVIHYTTDGTRPSASSPVYSAPVAMIFPYGTLRAVVVAPGMGDSAVVDGTYVFTMPAIIANAIFRLEPDAANITYGTGLNVATWKNLGTAGAALDISQGTDAKRPLWASNSGRYGGPGVTFAVASSQYLRSSVGTYPWNQPSSLLAECHGDGVGNRLIADGDAGVLARGMYFSTDALNIHAGVALSNGAPAVGASAIWGMYWGNYNGASSSSGREDESYGFHPHGVISGNAGANTANGITIGAEGGNNLPFNGPMDYALGWDSAYAPLSYANANYAQEYVASRASGNLLQFQLPMCVGDSLTNGVGAATPYPQQLQTLLGAPVYRCTNMGVSGYTIADVSAQFTIISLYYVARRNNIYACWVGSNDIAAGTTAATALPAYYAVLAQSASPGWLPLAFTIIVRSGITGAKETERVAFNADVVANWSAHATGLVDLAAIPELQDYTNLTYFQVDQTHLTTAGNAIVAAAVRKVVLAVLSRS